MGEISRTNRNFKMMLESERRIRPEYNPLEGEVIGYFTFDERSKDLEFLSIEEYQAKYGSD